ncbi:hypothetical protein PHYBLDRAFT_58590 [Phycomyces blakesleeanus NRRL 1555(-)]|uniref:Uncharacterized protein n=1 Tax=Phycomyces blakesleeanus (strain ATCC 8743b / DSM 1359 / FGSC 10004 / NBRC 33097 / NRRL 1555) TaxID=763407 RepID=A0A162V2M8_PHYB8|nr:hypothetical protein PHYBLDRAFT_58590 [Phycomyces blakesleeanus NRRL 1555(-)]OAD79542.1 hypothetical protein PHYBLDRAFT_58590 [Phycomyces blakesleeanus NRRL 1555(-)]|eukprot:XP_018297582.1 hypothetical protein PHYBLDRAFT_58590 [Phycomyces blakesleeanus NRRL 1555(-)]
MSNQNESNLIWRTPAERDAEDSLAILHRDMVAVMKDIADIKAKTLESPISAVLQSQHMAVAPAVAPVNMDMNVAGLSNMASEANSVYKTKAYRLLREQLWDPNFKSTSLATIQVNNDKPKWNTAVHFNQSTNTELTEILLALLERNLVGTGLRKSDVRDCVYTNFTSRKRAANKSEAKKKLTYKSYKAVIDDKMKRYCSGLIVEEAMSAGESDGGTLPPVSGRGLRFHRLGWRSDEYNHFIKLVDKKVAAELGSNSHQLLPHVFGETIKGPVPNAIASPFSQWALRDWS